MYFLGRAVSRIVRPVGLANGRNFSTSGSPSSLLTIHPEVADALARGAPVVALESTVITHGLSYPDNLKTAISCEENIRANGAIPATIGLLEGRMHVGLERNQLEILADVDSLKKAGKAPVKLSRRDIAPAMSLGYYGGTTIAGTTVLAHLAGIKVFATGGLGGVHRGGEISWDVSADLTELGRTPIAVIASGAKSILDIGRTLEYLETQGVTVAAYDNDGNWPAFFTAQSGYKAPWAFNNPSDAARAVYFAEKLGMQSGTIFGAPIPKEFEAVGLEIQKAVDQAVRDSEENGIAKSGRDATPWLLSRVKELTKGISIPSNIALLENNARIGARIAVEYAKLKANGGEGNTSSYQPVFEPIPTTPASRTTTTATTSQHSPLVIVGAAAMDITARPDVSSVAATHSTSPGSVHMSPGGVARNVAEAAHRVLQVLSTGDAFESNKPLLISPVGEDAFATVLALETEARGMRSDGLLKHLSSVDRTAVCNMFLDSQGDLQTGVADMGITSNIDLGLEKLLAKLSQVSPRIVAFDGNPTSETISKIVETAREQGAMTFFEPTSIAKCTRIIPALAKLVAHDLYDPYITGAFPNIIELRSMWEAARAEEDLISSSYWWTVVDTFGPDFQHTLSGKIRGDVKFLLEDGIIQMATQLLPFIKHLVIKCGSKGVVLVAHVTDKEGVANWISDKSPSSELQIVSRASDGSAVVIRYFPAHILDGDGDTLVGALLASLTSKGNIFFKPSQLNEAIYLAQKCAVLTIRSPLAVSPEISSMKVTVKWRKARGTGELICSEGHVLQGYINETNEVTEFGAHTVHRRHIRVGRRRKGPREQENPDIYHGPRARYLYYQCRQLILRHQLDSLVSEWELPAEAKNICRTMWLLALEILPQAPPPEPWIYAQTEQDQQEEEEEKESSKQEQPVETLDIPKEEQGQSSDTDGADDEAGNESQIEHELEELMREASTTESDSGSKKGDAVQGRKAYGRDTRHNLYNSAAMNISILVLTCWWLRIPVMYSDFINLINSYRIPYLNVVSLIPDNMQKHLSTAVRQELTPPHAPTVAGLNLITRRIARRLHANLGVDIPELNVAPILWRGVRAFQGPPTLYAMAKKLMERLEIPLTIHPSLAPRPSSGLQQQSGDWAPTEVSIACIMIIVLKLVYGFEENIRFVPQEEDPAACFPSFADYMISLRRGREEDSVSFSRLLSRHSERTAETLSNEELDKYLNVAERALGSHPMGNTKPITSKQLMSIYGEIQSIEPHSSTQTAVHQSATLLEGLHRPSGSENPEATPLEPGDRLIIWSPTDPLGVLPADYALLIDTASAWSGVEHSNINHLVAAMERRLHRSIAKERNEENTSSDSNGEYIDTDDVDLADSEEEKSFKGLKEEDADDADVEMSDQPTTFKFGSQKWRERVHNKLSQKRHPKGAYKEETASPELDESDMEEEDSKDNLAL